MMILGIQFLFEYFIIHRKKKLEFYRLTPYPPMERYLTVAKETPGLKLLKQRPPVVPHHP